MSKKKSTAPLAAVPAETPHTRARQRVLWAVVVAVLVVGAVTAWMGSRSPAPAPSTKRTDHASARIAPEFIDEQQCAGCHQAQTNAWQGSHHDLAMQEASAATVVGNFRNALFKKDGVQTRFFERDGKFWINTDSPDGKPADYEVKYTFGVEPLQQYLLELDRGRLQAFTIAWDTQGKRWFHLYPDERIDHKDELHWTKPSQNWNFMCAECHSTDLKKNYDPQTDTYQTTWKQIDVGCQACHGPASVHLAWAQKAAADRLGTGNGSEKEPDSVRRAAPGDEPGRPASSSDERTVASGQSASRGFNVDFASSDSTVQIETCARCHSRRAVIWDDYRHGQRLMDTHQPALLEESLYFADGQIDGEVYEYGSFLQSKMHQKGLRCSDCHEPHSLQTRGEGNALCTSCHNAAAPAARASIDTSGLKRKDYDSSTHHFHAQGAAGSLCVDCHAPQRTYMVVDPRRDHSFRIPRPDLSAKMGTPNACNGCHDKRSVAWATDTIVKWYGPDRRQEHTYGEVLSAARKHQQGAAKGLADLVRDSTQPAISRATALELMSAYPSQAALNLFRERVSDASALVRHAAIGGFDRYPPQLRTAVLPLLVDPVRAIRLGAVSSLASLPQTTLDSAQQSQMSAGIAEYEASQRESADHPASYMNLGNLYAALGNVDKAESAYQSAIRLNPAFVPAYVNLADLKSRTGTNAVAEPLLRAALQAAPQDATLHHSLGLALIREKRYDEAIAELNKAAKLAPQEPRFAYVYGVALHDTGRQKEGLAVLEKSLLRNPGNRDLLNSLASYAQGRGDQVASARYAEQLRQIESIDFPAR